jgi:predicted nucleic acid-binding Zn ribbon protein
MRKFGLHKRDGKLGKLGFAVNEYLAEGGALERSKSSLCAEIWPQVVGQWYGQHSRVVSLDRKELKVCCDTPALAQQLQYDQVTIITRLNERLGGNYIVSIRPASVGSSRQRQGLEPFAEDQPLPEDAELTEVTVPEAELRSLQLQASQVPEELRERWLLTAYRLVRLRHWRLARGYKTCVVCGSLHNDLASVCFACRVEARPDPMKG